MPFLDHLEELRWRLIKSLGSVLVGALITFFYIDPLIDFLIKPTKDLTMPMDLQVLKVQGMFMIKWGIALIGGFVLAIPVLTYQTWKFIIPGLLVNERKYLFPLIIFTFILVTVYWWLPQKNKWVTCTRFYRAVVGSHSPLPFTCVVFFTVFEN